MRLKRGVKLTGLTPQMAIANQIVNGVFKEFGVECVITSANDGTHGANSLHSRDGLCRAFDYRTHYVTLNGFEVKLRDEVKERLGDEFDVVMEGIGTPNEHLHVEHDPK